MPRPPREVPFVQLNFRVEPDVRTQFDLLCRARGIPAAEVLRGLLADYIRDAGDFK